MIIYKYFIIFILLKENSLRKLLYEMRTIKKAGLSFYSRINNFLKLIFYEMITIKKAGLIFYTN